MHGLQMPHMIQGMIFDLDGVLVHTDPYHCQAWEQIAHMIGVPFSPDGRDHLRDSDFADSLTRLQEGNEGPTLSDGDRQALVEQKNRIYRSLLSGLCPDDVPQEVRHLLKWLRESGVRTAVASSDRNARYILERTDLLGSFDAVADGMTVKNSRPDPEVLLKAAELAHLGVAACAAVEGTPAGIMAARRAGMLAVGVGRSTAGGEEDMAPDLWVDTVGDLASRSRVLFDARQIRTI